MRGWHGLSARMRAGPVPSGLCPDGDGVADHADHGRLDSGCPGLRPGAPERVAARYPAARGRAGGRTVSTGTVTALRPGPASRPSRRSPRCPRSAVSPEVGRLAHRPARTRPTRADQAADRPGPEVGMSQHGVQRPGLILVNFGHQASRRPAVSARSGEAAPGRRPWPPGRRRPATGATGPAGPRAS